MKEDSTVTIHGNTWEVSHVEEEVRTCIDDPWSRQVWRPSPALIERKGGSSRFYYGQKYDPKYFDLVEDGWTHDHCLICWWALRESDDPEESTGYSNESGGWICTECFERFVRDDELGLRSAANRAE